MNSATGKDLFQLEKHKLALKNKKALYNRAIDKAVMAGNLDEAEYLEGELGQNLHIDKERKALEEERIKDRIHMHKTAKSIVQEIMARSNTVSSIDLRQRLKGLSIGQQEELKKVIPTLDHAELLDALENDKQFSTLIEDPKRKGITSAEIEKALLKVIGRFIKKPSSSYTIINPSGGKSGDDSDDDDSDEESEEELEEKSGEHLSTALVPKTSTRETKANTALLKILESEIGTTHAQKVMNRITDFLKEHSKARASGVMNRISQFLEEHSKASASGDISDSESDDDILTAKLDMSDIALGTPKKPSGPSTPTKETQAPKAPSAPMKPTKPSKTVGPEEPEEEPTAASSSSAAQSKAYKEMIEINDLYNKFLTDNNLVYVRDTKKGKKAGDLKQNEYTSKKKFQFEQDVLVKKFRIAPDAVDEFLKQRGLISTKEGLRRRTVGEGYKQQQHNTNKDTKVQLGRYLIDVKKLKKNNILSMTYQNGKKIPTLPNMKVSDNLKRVLLHKQVNTKRMNLTDAEKLFLQQLVNKADVEVAKSKTRVMNNINLGQVEELKDDLVRLIGEIEAGNDNPKLVDEVVLVLKKLVALGSMTKKQANNVFQSIAQ